MLWANGNLNPFCCHGWSYCVVSTIPLSLACTSCVWESYGYLAGSLRVVCGSLSACVVLFGRGPDAFIHAYSCISANL